MIRIMISVIPDSMYSLSHTVTVITHHSIVQGYDSESESIVERYTGTF
jgi:hypothetical protein